MEDKYSANSLKEWPFFLKGRTDIIFVHIPKTAGTSIRYSMGFNNMDKTLGIRNHYKVTEILDMIGEEKWEKALKFTFVRNPWDRLYSFYCFRLKKNRIQDISHSESFKKWAFYELTERDPSNKKRFNLAPQSEWLIDKQNKIQLNFIGRFESLNEDYKKLNSLLSFNTTLPHLNVSTKGKGYRQQYDSELMQLVANYYQEDLIQFKYEF